MGRATGCLADVFTSGAPNGFARAALLAAGLEGEIRYDAADFTLHVDDGGVALHNVQVAFEQECDVLGIAPWEDVVRALAARDLEERRGLHPERWRVNALPSAEAFRALGSTSDDLPRLRGVSTMCPMNDVMAQWRVFLAGALARWDARTGSLAVWVLRLYVLFTVLNTACYWLGLLVAYPDKVFGDERLHYFVLQLPVGLLGAVFDTVSFFVTVWLIRRALRSTRNSEYVLHLSLDLLIAVVATFWVLFVFTAAGWIMSYIEAQPELLADRSRKYGARLESALRHPLQNWRNLYFGVVMGASASLPTLIHMGMFIRASWRSLRGRSRALPPGGDATT